MKQKYTEARKEGNRRWDAANLDRLSVALPKGMKTRLKQYAEAHGESVNSFIRRAIDEAMEREMNTPGGYSGGGEGAVAPKNIGGK